MKIKILITMALTASLTAFIGLYFNLIPSGEYKPEIVKKYLEQSLKQKDLTLGSPIFIRIFKKESELEIWVKNNKNKFSLFKTYPICYYSGKLGPKLKEGDKQAPEGFYKFSKKALNPNSRYHLSFNLGYPNKYDRSHKRTGNYLMVHGSCVSIGCYAMTDKQIEKIYTLASAAFEGGQKYISVHIFPFKMTKENLSKYSQSKWYSFWTNLKKGYDVFEAKKTVPKIGIKNKKYRVMSE